MVLRETNYPHGGTVSRNSCFKIAGKVAEILIGGAVITVIFLWTLSELLADVPFP